MEITMPFMSYLYTLPTFLSYLGMLAVAVMVFARVYTWITPHDEFALIRDGNIAAAISFVGALLGFSVAVSSVLIHATARTDFVLWAVFALLVQLLAYLIACKFVLRGAGEKIAEGNLASGVFVGGVSLAVGIINAALMVY